MSPVRLILSTFLVLILSLSARAAPTLQQRAEIGAIGTLMAKAGRLFQEEKFQESADAVKDAQARLEKLAAAADVQLLAQLTALHKRLTNAYALLELEGITLPELKPLEVKPKGKEPPPGGGISFVKQVAPVLNARCGNCHVRNARGMFSMATYEALITGSRAGKVIFPGDAKGSVLIEKVQDKEMPPSGAGIPDGELALLKQWVEEGARFDGPDPKAQLASLLTGQSQPAETPMLSVQQATGKETISFAKDIAPVLIANCTGCHGTNNPRGNFSLFTFEGLLRGGDRGQPVLPGKPADSLLVKKLKGTADGARMPMNRDPLDDATLAKIEKWIEEGCKFDGPDGKQSIVQVAALIKAQGQTHDELSSDRAKLAESNWRLGMPGTPPNRSESTNFLVMGSVGENTLADIAQRAEAQAPKVASMLKAPAGQPLVKGRMSLFVFAERYEYGEFGKMVEKRDLPSAWRGHFRYSIIDAYGAVLPSKSDDYSLDALIAQQLAAAHIASQGVGVPTWFAEGTGRVVATRIVSGRDSRIDAWDAELPRVFASMTKPDDFLTGKLPQEDADLAAYSFVKFVMSDARRFQILLDGLRKGGKFDETFVAAYGGTPAQLAPAWIRKPPKLSPRRPGARR
ncbi:MAG: c-type cytochrome domain-containing protein [Pirellulaceae bacterium]